MNILSKCQLSSSSGLGLTVFWIYFHKPSLTYLINDEAVCRTAPATPDLLKKGYLITPRNLGHCYLHLWLSRSHTTLQPPPSSGHFSEEARQDRKNKTQQHVTNFLDAMRGAIRYWVSFQIMWRQKSLWPKYYIWTILYYTNKSVLATPFQSCIWFVCIDFKYGCVFNSFINNNN